MESILFHGSDKVVEYPTLQGGRIHNDFGQGFYCTPDIEKEQAEKFAEFI